MRRKKNVDAILQIAILIATICLLIYAMLSKKINNYVHPRFYLGIWISIFILLLFTIGLIKKVKNARHNVAVRHYGIFLLPFLAAILFPSSTIIGGSRTEEITNLSKKTSQIEKKVLTEEEENRVYKKYMQYEKDGVMLISDEIFADWFDAVYDNLDEFKGKRCKYLAQVYLMEDFEENQFLAGRYFMVCCAADMVGYGVLCESDEKRNLKEEEWIMVEGTIEEYEYEGHMVPLLTDVVITKAEEPKVAYIYYNNY